MNFLLHRHLAVRRHGSPTVGHGAMLPDLWRMADRRVRPAPDAAPALDPVDAEVAAGIAHHLEADRWFHRSALFVEGEQAVAAGFRAAALAAPRMALLAHAAWELCLDGALVRRRGLRTTLDELAAGHHQAAQGAAQRAASRHHFDRVERSREERDQFERRMEAIVERLLAGDWVAAYTDGAGLAEVLDHMRRRLGLSALSAVDRAALAEVMGRMAARADASLDALLAEAP